MPRLLLNIGLDVKATRSISARVALEIIKANGWLVERHVVVQSDTEPTLVAEVACSAIDRASLYQIAQDLQQDCIAVYSPATSRGVLVGPRSQDWGAFNPEFFFLLNGKRLAPATQPT